MHAPTLPSVLRHTRRTLPHTSHRPVPAHATHVAPAAPASRAAPAASWTGDDHSEPHASTATSSWRISDLPERARIRPVRWLPLIVPGFALFLLACMALIGSVI